MDIFSFFIELGIAFTGLIVAFQIGHERGLRSGHKRSVKVNFHRGSSAIAVPSRRRRMETDSILDAEILED